MERESYLNKIFKLWDSLWDKISWTEVLIICLVIIISMTYIKFNVASYSVECDDGSIVEIKPGTNFVCEQIIDFNAWTGVVQVQPKPIVFEYNFNITK